MTTSPLRRLRLLAPLCLLLAACTSGPETKIDEEAQLQLHRELALRWYQMDDLQRAEDQVLKGLDLAPDDDQLLLMLGWILQRRGRTEDILVAERVFRELAPRGDYRASLGLASALERKGLSYFEASEGVASGETAVDDGIDREKRAGELREQAEDIWRESIEHYQETLRLSPDNARAMSGLQRVYSQLGDYEKSLRWAAEHRAVVLGEVEFRRRQLTGAQELSTNEEENLRRTIAKDEEALIANALHAAALLIEIGREDEALELLQEVIDIDPDSAGAYALRAQIFSESGQWADALKNVDRFLMLSTDLDYDHPDVRRAYELRSTAQRELGLERLRTQRLLDGESATAGGG